MRTLALSLIRFYQRFISPYKGFCCAYRYHTGRASCSTLGLRAIRRFGVWRGGALLRERLARCGIAHRRLTRPGLLAGSQAGFCDCTCDFDLFSACDGLGNLPCDCGLDWPSKKQDEEQQVHIPPARRHAGSA